MELDPNWVVGFVDGEGCFYIGINPQKEMTLRYQVLPEFRVVQHERDRQVLFALKRFFRCGGVRRNHGDRYELRIRGLESLKQVVEFFEKHPLKTRKAIDFKRFARVIHKMEQGKHLTPDGLVEIVRIAREMNRGNSKTLDRVLHQLTTDDRTKIESTDHGKP